MATILLVLSLSGDPLAPKQCDRAELNYVLTFCQSSGMWTEMLTQWIFWDFDRYLKRYVVREWKLDSPRSMPTLINGRWLLVTTMKDIHGRKRLVIIEPRMFNPTWTPSDPEVENRNIVPVEKRRGVTK